MTMKHLPKSLDYRRATRLREIRRMRAELFREIARYQLVRRVEERAPAKDCLSDEPLLYIYSIQYRGHILPSTTTPFVSSAVSKLFRLRSLSFRLGLIRIQEAVKDM